MKKVLIALDFDPSSAKVAEKGHELAKTMGAEVILLHVLYEPTYYSTLEYSPIMGFGNYMNAGILNPETTLAFKDSAQIFLDSIKQHLGDKSIKTMLKEGDTAETIVETATSLYVDIIVLGTHSRKWLENVLMGSITENVLKISTLPLFIIPTKNRS